MGLKLYMVPPSPPVRAVLLTAKALGLELELIAVNILSGAQFEPEYLKLNPQHTVPTLDDDGAVVWDSHAINIYLVTKYGEDSSLYPEDPHIRAVINQRLHFDSGVLFPTTVKVVMAVAMKEITEVPPERATEIKEAYGFMERFLEGQDWMAGSEVTLADLNLITTVTSMNVLVPIDEEEFPNITAWIKRAEDLPYYDANANGLDVFRNLMISSGLNA